MTCRLFLFIPVAIFGCIPMEPFDGKNGITFPSLPECPEITKGTTDVILTPSGTQVDQTTVTASCPAGTRLRIDNQSQAGGAAGTLTCSAGRWLDGTTVVTMVSCDPECPEITKGTTDVILTPSGTQVDQTTVTASCPAGTRLRIDNQSQAAGATGTLTCSAGGWLDGTTVVTMVSCDPECQEITKGTTDVVLSPPGSQLVPTVVTVSCPARTRLKVAKDNFIIGLSTICTSGSLWIGGHRYLATPPFVWTDNSPFVYTNWATGNPTTGTSQCILFDSPSGEWTNDVCSNSASFVCRYSSLTPTIQTSPATCPAGWTAMTFCGTSACYFVSTVPSQWTDANAGCHAFGVNAQLASIHCLAESDYIRTVGNNRGWVGGFRTFDIADFSWTDGTPVYLSTSLTVEKYDPKTDQWEKKPEMRRKRVGAAAAAIKNKIYVCGGYDGKSMDLVEVFHTTSEAWKN